MTMKSGKAGINLVSRIGLGGIKVFFFNIHKDVGGCRNRYLCTRTVCVHMYFLALSTS